MRKLTFVTLLATLGTAALPASSVLAASAQAQSPVQRQTPAKIDVSDQQLKEFIGAQKSVNHIRINAMSQLQQAKDKKAAQAIQQKANQDMVDAVRKSGLTVDNYNTIARALQTNKDLRTRLGGMK